MSKGEGFDKWQQRNVQIFGEFEAQKRMNDKGFCRYIPRRSAGRRPFEISTGDKEQEKTTQKLEMRERKGRGFVNLLRLHPPPESNKSQRGKKTFLLQHTRKKVQENGGSSYNYVSR